MMRLAEVQDTPNLQNVYAESVAFGNSVGTTDWKISPQYLESLITARQLHCLEDNSGINAAVQLLDRVNPLEWTVGTENYLYIAKLATANVVRGTGYVPAVVIPSVEVEATQRGRTGLRLNCFADNEGLIKFYSGIGFTLLGVAEFDSPTKSRRIRTAKFQKDLA